MNEQLQSHVLQVLNLENLYHFLDYYYCLSQHLVAVVKEKYHLETPYQLCLVATIYGPPDVHMGGHGPENLVISESLKCMPSSPKDSDLVND